MQTSSSSVLDAQVLDLAAILGLKGSRGGGGVGTRPWCWFGCLWRRLLASRHCTVRPPVGPNVSVMSTEPPDDLFCLNATGGRLSQRRAVARAVDQVHPDAHSMRGLPTPALTCERRCVHLQDNNHNDSCPFAVSFASFALCTIFGELLACGGAHWPLALEPSAMTSRHPHYCGHRHCRGHPPPPSYLPKLAGGGGGFGRRVGGGGGCA